MKVASISVQTRRTVKQDTRTSFGAIEIVLKQRASVHKSGMMVTGSRFTLR